VAQLPVAEPQPLAGVFQFDACHPGTSDRDELAG
jgi:hypothetical protein